MKRKLYLTVLLSVFIAVGLKGYSQIETTFLNEWVEAKEHNAMFFTNRPIEVKPDNSYTFKNKSTDKTNTLYFCAYNFNRDSIEVNYRAVNLSDDYPTGEIKNNLLYQIYEYQRLERGIKNFYIIVGGYGKSFKKQVHSYMKRLKTQYGDSLFNKAAILTFAWGVEDDAYQYYNAVRKAKNGAADFAVFQHMLDEFVSDSVYFENRPNDLTIDILFSSMGNHMFKEYLEEREKQNIPLIKTYNRILFVGSVAPRNSFQAGKAFNNLNQLTDSVDVYVNSKDILLKLSSVAHLKNRMGNKGPKNADELPDYINVINIKKLINLKDMAGLGHDYVLTNPVLQEELLGSINANIGGKEDPQLVVE